MNNRSANKENTYNNLGAWCKKYHEESGIKIHPSSVPYDLVLEDVLGYIAILVSHDNGMCGAHDHAVKRIDVLEAQNAELISRINLLGDTITALIESKKEADEKPATTKKVKK